MISFMSQNIYLPLFIFMVVQYFVSCMTDNLSCLLGSCSEHLLAKSLGKILMISYTLGYRGKGHGHF